MLCLKLPCALRSFKNEFNDEGFAILKLIFFDKLEIILNAFLNFIFINFINSLFFC